MDVLKDKQYKSYDRLSRYSNFPIYYNTLSKKYSSGTIAYLSDETEYTLYTVQDKDTYDSIALDFYNNPTYFWVICSFNRIADCFEKPAPGSRLKVPVISNIGFI